MLHELEENPGKKQKLGELGEALAATYLSKGELRVLHRNWHYKHKEIDIIAEDETFLIIVEVKTRKSPFSEPMEEVIPRKKQKFLIEAAEAYVIESGTEKEVRFDLVLVVIDEEHHSIEHIPEAFYPGIF